MKYIVTGGAGFIGSNLIDKLLEEGHEVLVIDDLSSGFVEYLPMGNKKLKLFIVDISQWEQLENIKQYFENVDGVFHTAAVARIQQAIRNPVRSHEVNIDGTFNILRLMKECGIFKIVFSSSSSTYGLNKCPQIETMFPDPLNPYSFSKFVGDNYIRTFCKLYNMSGINLKYFNVWGPREVLQGELAPVVGLFFRQVLMDKTPLTIIGDGSQLRDFTHVSDVVEANILAMNSNKCFEGEIFNIGSGRNYSILELADMVLTSLDLDKKYKEFIPARPAELRATKANNKKAGKILKWKPKIFLNEHINNHRDYYLEKWGL